MATNINLSEIKTFSQLLPIVQKAEPKISWSFARYTRLATEQDVGCDDLAECMVDLLEKNQNFSERERPLVKEISSHIDRIYDESDRLAFSNCNFVTCIFVWIRDLFSANFPYTKYSLTRWGWRECSKSIHHPGYNVRYLFYTKEQFLERTGKSPYLKMPHLSTSGQPDLWLLDDRHANYIYD